MLHLLLLILHHVTVGSHGRHLLHLRVMTDIVVTKKSGEARVHLRPDVVGCRSQLILVVVDLNLLAASTVESGV